MIRFWLTVVVSLMLFPGRVHAAQLPEPEVEPPIPPSPVDEFRQWLRMTAEQREKELQQWPDDKRVVLRHKLRVYEQFSVEERERRLRMLELRWYLRPL